MSEKPARYYHSPVDYEAWAKGYMPPSEHVLIDALTYRGAKVVSGCSTGESSWWFVVKGRALSRKQRTAIRTILFELYDDDEPAPPKVAPQNSEAPRIYGFADAGPEGDVTATVVGDKEPGIISNSTVIGGDT